MKDDAQIAEVRASFSKLLGRPVTIVERLGGGRNSRVFKLDCGGPVPYVGKVYFSDGIDRRDRLDAEFRGLQFLWDNCLTCIPRPIAADKKSGCAAYEFIDGHALTAQNITQEDIATAVQFLTALKGIKRRKGSDSLPIASEACFSAQAIIDNLNHRLDGLSALDEEQPPYPLLKEFLADRLAPAIENIGSWCRARYLESGLAFDSEIAKQQRTLSSSDFGFHNALRRQDGSLVFLDFEYFGWDDPAKMIADFLLHPAMPLTDNLRKSFVSDILGRFQDQPELATRLRILYPLFGLKWCLIFLNEFMPKDLARRSFASPDRLNLSQLQSKQLNKAKRFLDNIQSNYERFPYLN